MLVLNPRQVTFAGERWEDVTAVAIDRDAAREVVEWGDLGPHVALADVPEQRITVKVTQQVSRDDIDSPRPGDAGELTFYLSPAGTDAGRRRVRANVVVLRCLHEIGQKAGAVRVVEMVAVSSDGAADPIVVEDATGGEV